MGYEYSLIVKLTAFERQEITKLFQRKPSFSRAVICDIDESFEFRQTGKSTAEMPDFYTSFDQNGIYICQNLTSDPWNGLDDLRAYLISLNKTFEIEEV